ncbi:germin-like protein subfamily 1 member 11 [Cynara cardunculus var. scolymus]|uniref:germin-like protein subfamily 1 member 11 n=1 Tax=Cynara cardunculus var. scolymus TaxID=59895 RepID=UPI000D62B33C|nr:germin-like protein subfamily 1 member 11 [Cynara cardunculus var. scolymus]
MASRMLLLGLFVVTCSLASASDHGPLQDFCVTIQVGFVTSNLENCLISKVLNKGDVFVFPEGLVHFQQNVGNCNVVAIVGLSSQNPGVITIANVVFGTNPDIAS